LTTVVFYISGHGFGHASRVIEVINALLTRRDDVHIVIRTSAARWLFDLTIGGHGLDPSGRVEVERVETDTGIVQIDSLHLDAAQTVRRAREFMRTFPQRVRDESAAIAACGASLVVADIPALGVAAGKRAGVATVALGNFTWDWIYAGYTDTADIVLAIGNAYSSADVALRLPLHGGFDAFARVIDLPFIARRSRRDPAETRHALDLPQGERLVLVSFGGYGLDGLDLEALGRLDGYVALVSGSVPLADLPDGLRGGRRGNLLPFDERAMYDAGLRYEDLVRAVDVVVTKPGYGIISECVANDTALLYTSRGQFVEYDVLVAGMPRVVRSRFIDHSDLFAGRWTAPLDALLAQPRPPERPQVDGADMAAGLLLDMIDRPQPGT
jgi:L-arabinokinase